MSAETAADSEQKDEVLFVCQHSSKPNVVGSLVNRCQPLIYQNYEKSDT